MTNLKTVSRVLSPDVCAAIIERAELRGFASMAHRYPASYRNNDRIVIDDTDLAVELGERLAEHLPALRDGWRLSGLNTRFRICRYRDGQQFSIHRDGSHAVSDRERSLTTVMIYLNAPPAFTGGRTRFYASSRRGQPPTEVLVPQCGMAAVFDHDLWHDGEPVVSGTKYVLRTDVMYVTDQPQTASHRGYVWCLSDGPDGTIASGSRDCRVRLWRYGRLQSELAGHRGSVVALAMHDGKLWSASRDGELRRWDGARSTLVRREGPAILAMATAPDGGLACGTTAGEIERIAPGAPIRRTRRHGDWIWDLARDEEALITCSEDGSVRCLSKARSWRAFARTPLRALTLTTEGIVAAGADGRIRRWTRAGRPLPDVGLHDAAVCALASDGAIVYGGDEEGCVYRFDQGERTLVRRHRDQVRALLVRRGRVMSASYDYGVAFGKQTSMSAEQAWHAAS